MKRFKHIIKSVCLSVATLLALSSCQDWLTVYPQTQVVEENFWEDKNDLEGVRNAIYRQMASTYNSNGGELYLPKIVLWGDLRSDTYTLSAADQNTSTQNLYAEIRDGRLDRDSADTYFDWSYLYTAINYCNKVLQHGAEVLERDKQFTASEWLQMKAEVTTLRALNYFYLIRAFKDVPYSTKVINKDTEVESFGATNQLVVLDSLIADVESIKGQARNRFSSTEDTKGMITNAAIYALLSDMYLWRASLHQGRAEMTDTVYINNVYMRDSSYVVHTVNGDYQACIDYADLSLAALAKQTEDNNRGYGRTLMEKSTYGLTNVSLYKNEFTDFTSGTTPRLNAYSAIFSTGNSDESIFELQYNTSDNRTNGVVTSLWGYSTSVHLAVSDASLSAIYSGDERTRDSRLWFSAWDKTLTALNGTQTILPGLYCFKWRDISIAMPDENNPKCKNIKIYMGGESSDSYRNWIIYRMSDVMLQKAEALACLGRGDEAMTYVNAIHRRWYCNDADGSTLQPLDEASSAFRGSTDATLGNLPNPSTVTASEKFEVAVLNERQLEFIGEGKRWFDLVRFAERHAGGEEGSLDPRAWDYTDADGRARSSYSTPSASEKAGTTDGSIGVNHMIDQFLKNEFNGSYATLKNRFKNRYGLYNIIYYMEVKASNGKLEQNPVWNKSTYDQ